jgi:hypothetical protein
MPEPIWIEVGRMAHELSERHGVPALSFAEHESRVRSHQEKQTTTRSGKLSRQPFGCVERKVAAYARTLAPVSNAFSF